MEHVIPDHYLANIDEFTNLHHYLINFINEKVNGTHEYYQIKNILSICKNHAKLTSKLRQDMKDSEAIRLITNDQYPRAVSRELRPEFSPVSVEPELEHEAEPEIAPPIANVAEPEPRTASELETIPPVAALATGTSNGLSSGGGDSSSPVATNLDNDNSHEIIGPMPIELNQPDESIGLDQRSNQDGTVHNRQENLTEYEKFKLIESSARLSVDEKRKTRKVNYQPQFYNYRFW